MKKLMYALLILLVIIVLALGAAYMFLDDIVKNAANTYGPKVLGAPVSVANVSLKPIKGEFVIGGIKVGNSDKFKSENLISLGKVAVFVDMKSLFSDKIIVKSVEVAKPEITYEMISLTTNNISEFLKNMNANQGKTSASEQKAETKQAENSAKSADSSSKSVVIKNIDVTDGKIDAVMNVAGNTNSVSVVLPNINMKNVGEEKKQNIAQTVVEVVNQVLKTALNTVVNANVSDLKGVADENMNNIVDKVKEKVGNLGLFGK